MEAMVLYLYKQSLELILLVKLPKLRAPFLDLMVQLQQMENFII
jgi:hypothetical protein